MLTILLPLLYKCSFFQRERTPLIAACEGGHSETAQLLIEKGADLNKRDLV